MCPDNEVTITVFDEQLREIYALYQNQDTSITKSFDELGKDDIMEYLLLVNAELIYNRNHNVTSVESI